MKMPKKRRGVGESIVQIMCLSDKFFFIYIFFCFITQHISPWVVGLAADKYIYVWLKDFLFFTV